MKTLNNKLFAFITALCFVAVGVSTFAAVVYKPSQTSTISSAAELRLASPFSQNYVIDKPVIFFPVTSWNNLTTTDTLLSMGAGTVVATEVAASEIGGLLMNSDNDSHSLLFPIPVDLDVAQEIKFRAIWSESDTGVTGSVRWYFLYKQLTLDSTVIAEAAGTMTTDGAADPDLATEDEIQGSPWSTLAASTLTGTPGDDFLIIKCYVDVTSVSKATLLGIQMQYTRKWLGGDNL